jgi:hypothetical protein
MNNQVMQSGELEEVYSMTNQVLLFQADEILEKSIGGRQRRILGGYAAGTTKDFQDEEILMKGMDFTYLSSPQGKVNWDHTALVIGKPLAVGMLEKGLYVKGILSEKSDFPNPNHPNTIEALDRAEWAWDYALRHRADPMANPPLAWSVQGKKMEKGGKIIKSIVTEVALTDHAVNPNDCTVSAMAKSFREQAKEEAVNDVVQISGISVEEINEEIGKIEDGKTLIRFCKSIGLSVDQSKNFIKIVRGL